MRRKLSKLSMWFLKRQVNHRPRSYVQTSYEEILEFDVDLYLVFIYFKQAYVSINRN